MMEGIDRMADYKVTKTGENEYSVEKEHAWPTGHCPNCGEDYYDCGYNGYCSEQCYEEACQREKLEKAERRARREAFKNKSPDEKKYRILELSIKVSIVGILMIAEIVLSFLLCKKIYVSAKYAFFGGIGVFFVGGICFIIISCTPSFFEKWIREEGKIKEIGKSVLRTFGETGKMLLWIVIFAASLFVGFLIAIFVMEKIPYSPWGGFFLVLCCPACTLGIALAIKHFFFD